MRVVEELDTNPGLPFPGVLPASPSCPRGPPQAPKGANPRKTPGCPLSSPLTRGGQYDPSNCRAASWHRGWPCFLRDGPFPPTPTDTQEGGTYPQAPGIQGWRTSENLSPGEEKWWGQGREMPPALQTALASLLRPFPRGWHGEDDAAPSSSGVSWGLPSSASTSADPSGPRGL